ncbi:RICIN domain-containing protein, partial [Kitasatospora sp. NPDC059747]|uniref:RICIN domain-containing protein n=1 Tax=Kitasatospora sp. NPDC059747 TaxID=3346930 RepID=UPI0036603A71
WGARRVRPLHTGPSTTAGAALVQQPDNGSDQQQWSITALGGGSYQLTNRASGMAVDNGNGTVDGQMVVQWTVNGGTSQQWNLVKVG